MKKIDIQPEQFFIKLAKTILAIGVSFCFLWVFALIMQTIFFFTPEGFGKSLMYIGIAFLCCLATVITWAALRIYADILITLKEISAKLDKAKD